MCIFVMVIQGNYNIVLRSLLCSKVAFWLVRDPWAGLEKQEGCYKWRAVPHSVPYSTRAWKLSEDLLVTYTNVWQMLGLWTHVKSTVAVCRDRESLWPWTLKAWLISIPTGQIILIGCRSGTVMSPHSRGAVYGKGDEWKAPHDGGRWETLGRPEAS